MEWSVTAHSKESKSLKCCVRGDHLDLVKMRGQRERQNRELTGCVQDRKKKCIFPA